jgi:hypothetical protein
MLFTDDVQAYSDKPSPSPFPLSFLLTMFAALTFNSVTLLRLHFLQLTTTRSLSPTSCSSSTASPCPAAFPPAYNNKVAFSYIISSSTASPCPAAFPPAYNNKVAFFNIMLIINSLTLSSCISSSLQQQGRFLVHHAHHQQPHLVQLHFLQLTTTRSLSPTSFHHQQHHLVQLHFLQLATKRYSSLFHSSLISVAPGSTKWQNLSHFA